MSSLPQALEGTFLNPVIPVPVTQWVFVPGIVKPQVGESGLGEVLRFWPNKNL